MTKNYIFIGILLVIVIIISVSAYLSKNLQRTYENKVKKALAGDTIKESEILMAEDIKHLPEPVQNYLNYVGVIGKEKVHSFKVIADGEFKMNRDSKWVKIQTEQYNFTGSNLVRLFYLRMKMSGIPIYALHTYTDKEASMLGKVAGLFTVINSKGTEMRISDTITLLNDMCLFAPATLIDKRISWEQIDDNTVNAILKTEYCTVTATLYFNQKSELIKFVSKDRYYSNSDDTYQKKQWTTPFSDYKEINGLMLPSYGEAIWNMTDGDYSYCKFTNIKSIIYNVEQ